MESVVVGIASFFGGSFLTMVVFVVGYSSRLTSVETTLREVNKKLTNWEERGLPNCAFGIKIDERLRKVEIDIGRKED